MMAKNSLKHFLILDYFFVFHLAFRVKKEMFGKTETKGFLKPFAELLDCFYRVPMLQSTLKENNN